MYNNGYEFKHNGITYIFNNDGSVVVNGILTEGAEYSQCFITNSMNLSFETKISGLPSGASENTYFYDGTNLGMKFNEDLCPLYTSFRVCIKIVQTTEITNLVFRPMIRPACISDDIYNLYSMKLQDLTKNVLQLNNDLNSGVYNLSLRNANYIKFSSVNSDTRRRVYLLCMCTQHLDYCVAVIQYRNSNDETVERVVYSNIVNNNNDFKIQSITIEDSEDRKTVTFTVTHGYRNGWGTGFIIMDRDSNFKQILD